MPPGLIRLPRDEARDLFAGRFGRGLVEATGGEEAKQLLFAGEIDEDGVRPGADDRQASRPFAAARRMDETVARSGFDQFERASRRSFSMLLSSGSTRCLRAAVIDVTAPMTCPSVEAAARGESHLPQKRLDLHRRGLHDCYVKASDHLTLVL